MNSSLPSTKKDGPDIPIHAQRTRKKTALQNLQLKLAKAATSLQEPRQVLKGCELMNHQCYFHKNIKLSLHTF